jgi:hypothetical protein
MRVFEENQKFTQSWIMVIVGISLLVPLIIIIKEWSEKDDKSFQANLDLIITLGILCLSITPLLLIKLKTRIDKIGIHYQFYPFHLKYRIIKWQEMDKAYVRKYDAIGEYGGWGLKGGLFFRKSGVAYNVSGNIGIQIFLKKGKKILIGTQEEEKAIQTISYNQNISYE